MRKKTYAVFCFPFSTPSPLPPNPQKKTQPLKKKVCHVQKNFSDLAGIYHIQIVIVSVFAASSVHRRACESSESKIETYAKLVRNLEWRQINNRNLRKQNCKVDLRETCAKLRMASNQQSKPPKPKLQG